MTQPFTDPVADALITVVGSGPDDVFGTADDTTATMNTDASGDYSITVSRIGQYQLSTPLPPSVTFKRTWIESAITYRGGATAWSWQLPASNLHTVNANAVAATAPINFVAVNSVVYIKFAN